MSALTSILAAELIKIEETAAMDRELQKQRLTHHLMPPTGWLNDPNGLCYFKGRYHVFFQYSPFDAEGGLKLWGHYSSEDLVSWRYEGVPLYPDSSYDCHGVYSGSAIVEDEKLHLFFTGNVKMDGDYDHINNGREASTLHVESEDGIHFGVKEVAVDYQDYPETYTRHVRDPKVWKDDDAYFMALGGRKKNDQGAVLIYRSENLKNWTYDREITTEEPFGYMWECPDMFKIEGQQVLSVSPQGLKREEYRFQNVYQSGYFLLKDGKMDVKEFQEWDMGFDFYAPQTFEDARGRRILIGWMGLPDVEGEYTNPTAEKEGWQHCLTVPREIRLHNGRLYQYPVEELKVLRGRDFRIDETQKNIEVFRPFELEMKLDTRMCRISFGTDLILEADGPKVWLRLSKEAGAGRRQRNAILPSGSLEELRILVDTTAVEIYLNHGEIVFSTRYYPEKMSQTVKLEAEKFRGHIYELKEMTGIK